MNSEIIIEAAAVIICCLGCIASCLMAVKKTNAAERRRRYENHLNIPGNDSDNDVDMMHAIWSSSDKRDVTSFLKAAYTIIWINDRLAEENNASEGQKIMQHLNDNTLLSFIKDVNMTSKEVGASEARELVSIVRGALDGIEYNIERLGLKMEDYPSFFILRAVLNSQIEPDSNQLQQQWEGEIPGTQKAPNLTSHHSQFFNDEAVNNMSDSAAVA